MKSIVWLVALLCFGANHAWALGGLQPEKSRIIYRSGDKEASISFVNQGTDPLLVQAWVDDGIADLGSAGKPAAYVVTPPVFRVDPGKAQVVRLFRVAGDLPQDRESVSYLNALYINQLPRSASADEADGELAGGIRLSVRHRIKIFHRPQRLEAGDVSAQGHPLQLRLLGTRAQPALELVNPGPFHVSLAGHVQLDDGQADTLELTDGMLAPFERRVVDVPRQPRAGSTWRRARYRVVNDFGGNQDFEQDLSPAAGSAASAQKEN